MKYQKYLWCWLCLTILLAIVGCQKETSHDPNCVENIKSDCVCPAHYDPVCGCNGKTYGNSCEACCAGIRIEKLGPCE